MNAREKAEDLRAQAAKAAAKGDHGHAEDCSRMAAQYERQEHEDARARDPGGAKGPPEDQRKTARRLARAGSQAMWSGAAS